MPKQEAVAANRLLLYAMLLAASYTLMRTVGDSLFLSRVGSDSLALVFVVSGIATACLASIWYGLTRRLSLSSSIRISSCAFAVFSFSSWVALPYLHHSWWLLAAIYLLTELKGCVSSINVVAATNEVLGGHSSRHAWARIGLGAPFAGLIVGVIVGIEASIDLRTWLLISVLLDLLALWPLLNLQQIVVPKTLGKIQRGTPNSLFDDAATMHKEYACSRQFRLWIGILIAAKVVVLTFVTFLWKISANEYFGGNEHSLARYFGIFYAAVGFLTLLVQGFVTGRLLSRRNLAIPILVMPATLSILCTGIVFGSGATFSLVAITLAKSLEIWRRSVHDTTLGLLYTKIQRNQRRLAISINAAFVKPISEVGASLVLYFCAAFWHKTFLLFAVVIWIIATVFLLRLLARVKNIPHSGHDISHDESLGIKQLENHKSPANLPTFIRFPS